MSWIIRVGNAGFEGGKKANVIPTVKCQVTSNACQPVVQLSWTPGAGKMGTHGAHQAEEVWQKVLSTLVGM